VTWLVSSGKLSEVDVIVVVVLRDGIGGKGVVFSVGVAVG
jgi:hypothetical protein